MIERGTIQHQIQESAYRNQQAIDRGEQTVVGVNRFADEATVANGALHVKRVAAGERAEA